MRRFIRFSRCALLGVFFASGFIANTVQATGLIAGDLNHDGDVDITDADLFLSCLSGPGTSHNGSDLCDEVDLDHDGDVDVADFGLIQACFTGANVSGDPACGGCVRPRANRTVSVSASRICAGDGSVITVANSQVGASYQLRDNATNASVGAIVAGTGGTIQLPTGPLAATTAFNVLAVNPIWGCSVQLATTATIATVSPCPRHSRIGLHVVQGPRPSFSTFIDTCNNAGKPVAVIKGVDDFGACHDAKTRTPINLRNQLLTIGRKNELTSCSWGSNCDLQGFDAVAQSGTPPALHAQRVFNDLKPIWDANPAVDVWEICNEWSAWWAWQADFYIAMMDLCEATTPPAGHPPYRIALFVASAGNPPESAYPDIVRACARAKAHGNHMLALHEYPPNGLWEDCGTFLGGCNLLRYRNLYAYLAQYNADCPLVLSEVGVDGGGGIWPSPPCAAIINNLAWYDSELRKDPYVVGCAVYYYYVDSPFPGGNGCDYAAFLVALADYIVSQP